MSYTYNVKVIYVHRVNVFHAIADVGFGVSVKIYLDPDIIPVPKDHPDRLKREAEVKAKLIEYFKSIPAKDSWMQFRSRKRRPDYIKNLPVTVWVGDLYVPTDGGLLSFEDFLDQRGF